MKNMGKNDWQLTMIKLNKTPTVHMPVGIYGMLKFPPDVVQVGAWKSLGNENTQKQVPNGRLY